MSEENNATDEAETSVVMILLWVTAIIGVIIFAFVVTTDKTSWSAEGELFNACENDLKDNLKSPGTYKMVKKTVIAGGETQYVSIDYDAQNGYGALLRGNYWCTFEKDGTLRNGRHRN